MAPSRCSSAGAGTSPPRAWSRPQAPDQRICNRRSNLPKVHVVRPTGRNGQAARRRRRGTARPVPGRDLPKEASGSSAKASLHRLKPSGSVEIRPAGLDSHTRWGTSRRGPNHLEAASTSRSIMVGDRACVRYLRTQQRAILIDANVCWLCQFCLD